MHLLDQSLGVCLLATALILLVELGNLLFAHISHCNPAIYGYLLLSIHDIHLYNKEP